MINKHILCIYMQNAEQGTRNMEHVKKFAMKMKIELQNGTGKKIEQMYGWEHTFQEIGINRIIL